MSDISIETVLLRFKSRYLRESLGVVEDVQLVRNVESAAFSRLTNE